MTDQDILEKTAKYEMHYSPRNYRYHRQRFEQSRSTYDHMTATRSPLRTIDRTRYLRDPHPLPQLSDNDPILDYAVVPGFSVSTGEPSDDEEVAQSGPPSPRPWQNYDTYGPPYIDRYRPRYNNPANLLDDPHDPSNPTSDSDDFPDHTADAAEMAAVLHEMGEHSGTDARRSLQRSRHERQGTEAMVNRLHAALPEDTDSDDDTRPPSYRRSGPNRIGLRDYGNPEPSHPPGYERLGSEPDTASGKSPSGADRRGAVSTSASDTLAPHSRFFIPRSRSSVAVKFDPPV
jgi:hypothetical protein